ncbi:MAG: putative Ig domain-containing protein [Synergistaceae bacterium]|nr:putative Ig domain-containing protein [Synergistaceae bacterium]
MQKKIWFMITVSALLCLFSVSAFAEAEIKATELPLSKEFLEWQALPDEDKDGVVPFPIDLSYTLNNPPNLIPESSPTVRNDGASASDATFDLRNENRVTPVKNQGSNNTCWAFSSIGAMESNYLTKYGTTLDLSEMHLAWFTFKNSDKSKAFKNLSSANFSTVMSQGGNSFYPTALYSRLEGPASETDVPYSGQPSAATPDTYTPQLRVTDVYYLNFVVEDDSDNINRSKAARDVVKNRIINNGAVVASYKNDDSAYNKTSNGTAFYSTNSGTGHAVMLVGWNDNFSKTNFKTQPSSDGAWLVKNSWGTSWGDNGYFWMSYEQTLRDGTSFIVEQYNDDMKAYYYDALGWCGTRSYSNSSQAYFANVFQSERDGEILTEVAFYTPDNNINYEIDVYTGMTSMPSSSPINGSSQSHQTGSEPYVGYHTVKLDTPVNLTNGEYFSVVIKFTNTDTIPVESKNSGFSDNATFEAGSFISAAGTSWSSGTNSYNTCVRAFTQKDSASGPPEITTSSLPDGFVNGAYSAKISASGTRPIEWSLESGSLPDGLTLGASNGIISGTPTTSGDFSFTVKAHNDEGDDTKNFTLKIIEKPTITTTELIGYASYAFSGTLELSSTIDATWSISSGKLPKGLSLNASTGVISGKPTKKETANLTVAANTAAGEITASVNIIINAKPAKPKVSTSKLTDGNINKDYSAQIKLSGTTPISLDVDGLPKGLSMDSAGKISGVPTEAGDFIVKLTAQNIFTEYNNAPVTKNIKLKIKATPPVIAEPDTNLLGYGVAGQEYAGYQFELSEGTEPVTWTASALPKGMTLSSSGKLTGTPTQAKNAKINLKVSNSGGKASLKVPFTVYQIPTITTTKISEGTTGKKYNTKFAAKGTGPISWDIVGLPDTLNVTTKGNNATITGTPTSADTYSLNVIAYNIAGSSDVKTFELKVKGVAPKIKASLAKSQVDTEYTGSQISATGTRPISFDCSIDDADKEKFGINALADLGLSFTFDAAAGTAAITGTPTKSIKGLPLSITATNVAGTATKKIKFIVTGTKPAITAPTDTSMTVTPGQKVSLEFTATGTKDITFSMAKVNGFELTQTGDYKAVVSGTVPDTGKKVNISVTATNADGKATKKITLQIQAATTEENNSAVESLGDSTSASEDDIAVNENEVSDDNTTIDSQVVRLGGERSIKSLGSYELDTLKDYTIAAVLPEISVSESGMYDFEVEFDDEIEAEQKLFWFAFPKNRNENDDDEIAEFFDMTGAEITKTNGENEILISVWLNEGDLYAPVIAVKDAE